MEEITASKKEIFYPVSTLKCEATIDVQGFCTKIRIVSKVPRGQYYSCLNMANETASEMYKFRND